MARKEYEITIEGTATITIDDEVIERGLSEEFTQYIGKMKDNEAVIKHIAYNLIVNRAKLTQLDGFADMDDDKAQINLNGIDWSVDVYEG